MDRYLDFLGGLLIALGVGVWVLYALVRWGLGWDVTGLAFLPYHLAGVVPGALISRRRQLAGLFKRPGSWPGR